MLALLLILSAVGAFVLTMTAETLAELGFRWQLVRLISLIYGLTATVAAVGLWKLRPWAYVALVGWVAAFVLAGLSWPLVFPITTMPWWAALIWIAAVAVIVTPAARYIRRVLAPAT